MYQLILTLLVSAILVSFEPNANEEIIDLQNHIQYYEDNDGLLSLNQVMGHTDFAQLRDGYVPGGGVFNGTIWLKVDLRSLETTSNAILKSYNIFWDTLEVYSPQQELLSRTGVQIPINEWPKHSEYFELPLNGNHKQLIIRLVSSDASFLSFFLLSKTEAAAQFQNHVIFAAIFSGLMITTIIYCLIMFFNMHEKPYLLLALSTLFALLLALKFIGFAPMVLWPGSAQINTWSGLVMIELFLVSQLLFVYAILELRGKMLRLKPVIIGLVLLHVAILVIGFPLLDKTIMVRIMHIIPQFSFLIITVMGIYAWKHKVPTAKYFTMGWVSLTLFSLPFALRNAGVAPDNFFTQNSTAFGNILEVFFFLMAVSRASSIVKEERDKLQQNIVNYKAEIERLDTFVKYREQIDETGLIPDFKTNFELINMGLDNKLSERELEVLNLMIKGLNNVVISDHLFVSVNTIKKHIAAIYRKLGVNNRVDATKLAYGLSSEKVV